MRKQKQKGVGVRESFSRTNANGQTVDVKRSGEIGGTGCVFGHASVLAHVLGARRLDVQSAHFATEFADRDFVIAFDFGVVKKPVNRDGRVPFGDCAGEGHDVPCVNGLLAGGEGHDLRQN